MKFSMFIKLTNRSEHWEFPTVSLHDYVILFQTDAVTVPKIEYEISM